MKFRRTRSRTPLTLTFLLGCVLGMPTEGLGTGVSALAEPNSARNSGSTTSHGQHKTYWDVWGPEIQALGLASRLRPPEAGRYRSRGILTILDISASGGIGQWQIDPPDEGFEQQAWLDTSRKALRSSGAFTTTRLIILREDAFYWCQDLIGLEYGIEPIVFKHLAGSGQYLNRLLNDFDHLHNYTSGPSPDYLQFGHGWFGKIITIGARHQLHDITIKNVCELRFFPFPVLPGLTFL